VLQSEALPDAGRSGMRRDGQGALDGPAAPVPEQPDQRVGR
jgi:hypothetical protein